MHLISAIDNDFYGEILLEEARRTGASVSNCIRLHGYSTVTCLAIASEQEGTILAINDAHILQQLTPQLLNISWDLTRYAGMVLADHNPTPEALERVFIITDEIPMFVDTVSKSKANKVRNWYNRIHILKPTQNELEILWGQPIKDDNDHIRAVNSLYQQDIKRILVYLKGESVFCSNKDRKQFLPTASAHTTIDSSGADDGLMAGLVYSFLEGYSFRDSTRSAVVYAAISRTSGSLDNSTLSADNALSLVPMM